MVRARARPRGRINDVHRALGAIHKEPGAAIADANADHASPAAREVRNDDVLRAGDAGREAGRAALTRRTAQVVSQRKTVEALRAVGSSFSGPVSVNHPRAGLLGVGDGCRPGLCTSCEKPPDEPPAGRRPEPRSEPRPAFRSSPLGLVAVSLLAVAGYVVAPAGSHEVLAVAAVDPVVGAVARAIPSSPAPPESRSPPAARGAGRVATGDFGMA